MNNEVVKEQIDYLKRFTQEVSSTRRVDKNMVISLEQFIGENIITSKLNVNKLPNTPRDMYIEDVVSNVESKVKDMEKTIEAPSRSEVMDLLHYASNDILPSILSVLSSFLFYDENKQDFDNSASESKVAKIVSAFTNEKYIYRYDGETLTDITTLPIDVLYGKYKDYIMDVHLELTGKPIDPSEFCSFTEEQMSSICPYYNFLLALLKCEKPEGQPNLIYPISWYMEKNGPKQITIRDVIEVAENARELTIMVRAIRTRLQDRLNQADDFFMDAKEFELFKKLDTSLNSLRHGVVPTTINYMVRHFG